MVCSASPAATIAMSLSAHMRTHAIGGICCAAVDSPLLSFPQIFDGRRDALNTYGAARGSVIGRRRRSALSYLSSIRLLPPLLLQTKGMFCAQFKKEQV
jgi:hypothetical protein